jgi:ubiquinone/menaquinone biosynthesis C-methylase UbiE
VLNSATSVAQLIWRQVLRDGDTAVDATAGNGRDALALAELVGPTGRLVAVDLQVFFACLLCARVL